MLIIVYSRFFSKLLHIVKTCWLVSYPCMHAHGHNWIPAVFFGSMQGYRLNSFSGGALVFNPLLPDCSIRVYAIIASIIYSNSI